MSLLANWDDVRKLLQDLKCAADAEISRARIACNNDEDRRLIDIAENRIKWLYNANHNVQATIRGLHGGIPISLTQVEPVGQSVEEVTARQLSGNYKTLWVACTIAHDIDKRTLDLLSIHNSPIRFGTLPSFKNYALVWRRLADDHRDKLANFTITPRLVPIQRKGNDDPIWRDPFYLGVNDETEQLFPESTLPAVADAVARLLPVQSPTHPDPSLDPVKEYCDVMEILINRFWDVINRSMKIDREMLGNSEPYRLPGWNQAYQTAGEIPGVGLGWAAVIRRDAELSRLKPERIQVIKNDLNQLEALFGSYVIATGSGHKAAHEPLSVLTEALRQFRSDWQGVLTLAPSGDAGTPQAPAQIIPAQVQPFTVTLKNISDITKQAGTHVALRTISNRMSNLRNAELSVPIKVDNQGRAYLYKYNDFKCWWDSQAFQLKELPTESKAREYLGR